MFFISLPESKVILLFILLSGIISPVNSRHLQTQNLLQPQQWCFEKNHGQLADENGLVLNDIKYYGRDKGINVYFRKNSISFVFIKTDSKNKNAFSEATGAKLLLKHEETKEVKISTSRIDLEILNANPETQILAEERISYYTNYYLAHTPDEGITHVPHFKKLTYKNIYSNIDLVLYVKAQGMKYEFIVHPKGKVSDIKLSWNGTKPDVLQNGCIKYASTLGEMTESKPFTFISENGKEVKSSFKVKGNVIGFEVGKYDESKKLVIDPNLIWGTYYGGEKDDVGNGITTDLNNNVYVTGNTSSTIGIGTAGTHQSYITGTSDVFIAKFNYLGERQWGTYYGGESREISQSITLDKNNNLFITGWTTSVSGIATPGAYQSSLKGEELNALVAKFNNSGLRQWGTYFGGGTQPAGSWCAKIVTDGNGDAIVIGTTAYDTGLATPGAHQTSIKGEADAFIVKFNTNGNRIWATYYGGDKSEAGYGISVDKINNIYITGFTSSTSDISSPGAFQTTLNEGGDAFIAKFNSDGRMRWGTYFGGSGGEVGNDIYVDKNNNILVTGLTTSLTGIATTGVHQISAGGGNDVFIVKFTDTGNRLWATYYGGSGYEAGDGITADDFGDIYVTGSTNSTSEMATSGSHQESFGGGFRDGFIVKFSSQGSRIWGSYYGGQSDDYSICISTNRESYVHISGYTQSLTGLTTDDAYQSNFGGGQIDAFIAKFGIIPIDEGPISIDVSYSNNICEGNQEILIRVKNFTNSFTLSNSEIGWSVNGIAQKNYYWQGTLKPGDTSAIINIGTAYFKGGKNIIKIWTTEPNGNEDINHSNDTLTKTIYFLPTPEAKTGNDTSICTGESVTLGADKVAGNLYSWTSKPPGFISSQSRIKISPTNTTIYYLKETDTTSGCAKIDSVAVIVHPFPEPLIIGDTEICGKNTAVFETPNTTGNLFSWQIEGGSIISGQSTNSITADFDKNTKSGKIKLTETNAGGCTASTIRSFNYQYSALSDLSPDKTICESFSRLIKIDSADRTYYRWYPDESDSINFITIRKVKNYYVVVNDICNKEFQQEIKIFSKCPLSLLVYPNPAQKDITIRYSLPESVNLKISLYDRLGKELLNVADGFHEPGMYAYKLDADKDNLSAAIYVVRMIAGEEVLVKQFILLK